MMAKQKKTFPLIPSPCKKRRRGITVEKTHTHVHVHKEIYVEEGEEEDEVFN